MKKILFMALIAIALSSCGTAYNSQLKQVQLNMSRDQIVNLMGDKYLTTGEQLQGNTTTETIEYADRYKNHWMFTFQNGRLVKWWKEVEQ